MAALTRVLQKIFGSSAGTDQRGIIGSFAAGTPTTTVDPLEMQSLSNYLAGWYSVVVGQNSPAIQDMNALDFLITRQLAYIFERGVPEYDSTTTYYTGCLVTSAGVLYVSLTNNNLGNALTSSTNWYTPQSLGLRTANTIQAGTGFSVAANETMTWPNMTIDSGKTVVVPSSANLIGLTKIVASGTGVLQATGTGVIRVI